jgi:hypothetical protein
MTYPSFRKLFTQSYLTFYILLNESKHFINLLDHIRFTVIIIRIM